ncbi:MAG: DUF4091 domain-containing protein [Clostridia bacterium]|nr:DUF4091 domain-containing protein [Clostridia bacterium]
MDIRVVSSLAKVFPDEICGEYETDTVSCLKNERTSFQIIVKNEKDAKLSVSSDCANLEFFRVIFVPANYIAQEDHDDYYIRNASAGYYPDALAPLDGEIELRANEWTSVWCQYTGADDKEISVVLRTATEEKTVTVKTEVAQTSLDEQTLTCTNWFHSDCLADFYNVPVWSEEHWMYIENFMKAANAHGINFILTPLFTPPLDTAVGGERTTVQLVDVKRHNYQYTFGFDKLKRWIDLAFSCGMKYIEFSHLFTQWGAIHAPKIMAETSDGYKRIFGWETNAHGKRYSEFLRQFAKALIAFIDEQGIRDKVMFHTSDEPSTENYFKYKKSAQIMNELFGEFKSIDALSSFRFFKNGLVKNPVPCINDIEDFAGKVPELWTYYCCYPHKENMPNRFIGMPSLRNRILGFIMYKYDVKGFLNWGLNFYNTQYSKEHINPFEVTDAGGKFPAGDSFVLYPAADGTAYASLRFKVFYDAIQDYEALRLLEKKIGRKETLELLEKGLDKPLDIKNYPHCEKWLIEKRREINSML